MGRENAPDGSRRYVSVYGKTYGEVKARMEGLPRSGTACGAPGEGTMGEAVGLWLEERRPYWKQSTYAAYSHLAGRYILPELGDVRISSVTEETLEGFISGIRKRAGGKELSNRYLRNICGVAIRAMRYVKKKRHYQVEIPENQVRQERDGQMMLPGGAEFAVLERHLVENVQDDTCLGILISFYTGLRIGEACALTWEDIDLQEGMIHIRRNLQRVRAADGQKNNTEILVQTPKTCTSLRTIPIPPVLRTILQTRKGEGEGYIIKGKRKPWAEPRTLQYRFAKILERCRLEGFHFHTLRHAFATRCIAMGFDVKSLSEILGHSNIQVTLNLYVHSSMERKKQLMGQLDGRLYQDCDK